ncbi:hypothetical protein K438DRAFT_1853764 [Mycena galopus ATCC 62051]|nr:hypothetical protein K438DRAFT_1853764 [Mycena galopus ATCC 62051]
MARNQADDVIRTPCLALEQLRRDFTMALDGIKINGRVARAKSSPLLPSAQTTKISSRFLFNDLLLPSIYSAHIHISLFL